MNTSNQLALTKIATKHNKLHLVGDSNNRSTANSGSLGNDTTFKLAINFITPNYNKTLFDKGYLTEYTFTLED